jgi:cytochrome b involved in lipid metabolism
MATKSNSASKTAPGHRRGAAPAAWAWFGRRSELPSRKPCLRVNGAQLRAHATANDAWTAIHGVVYDITAYLAYHPGGAEILLDEAAGKDGTAAFTAMHPWVNVGVLLRGCEVGIFTPGDEGDE